MTFRLILFIFRSFFKDNRLFAASKKNLLEELKKLVDNCKEAIDINKRHVLGWTALHIAVINKNLEYKYS